MADGGQLILSLVYDRQGKTVSSLRTEEGTVIKSLVNSPKGLSHDEQVIAAEVDQNLPAFRAVMQELARVMYIGPFRNAINVGGQGSYYDIQTGDSFIRAFADYKSGASPEWNEAVYSLIQDIKRIFGFESLDINPTNEYQSLQLTVDGRSYRLAEQGAGLSHFILVLINVLVRRPSFLLIDEPETNLHASLQLDFLQTLTRYTDYGIIFATHSMGLARSAADTIYTLAKPVGGTSSLRPYGDDRELVTLLGQLSFDRRPDLDSVRSCLLKENPSYER